MKMRCCCILLFFLFLSFPTFCQKPNVEGIYADVHDLSANTEPRYDLNKERCALVKVRFVAKHASFEGNIIGDVIKKEGEYWVYMTKGSRYLTVKHPDLLPTQIMLDKSQPLESGVVYVLTLSIPDSMYATVMRRNDSDTNDSESSERKCIVSGKVFAENDSIKPLGGVTIYQNLQEGSYESMVYSSADGSYSIPNIKLGDNLTFTYKDYQTQTATLQSFQDAEMDITMKLKVIQKIRGTVCDRKGNPMPGVAITLKEAEIHAISDKNGDFEITTEVLNGILQFTYVGMKTVQIHFKDVISRYIVVKMEEWSKAKGDMDEIITMEY